MAQEFYCMKCKKKYKTDDFQIVKTKNGRNMAKAVHSCGTKGSRFVK